MSPYEQAIENTRRLMQPPPPSAPQPQPDTAGPAAAEQAAAEKRTAIYNTYREHLQKLDPENAQLKLEPASGTAPDQSTTDDIHKEVARIVDEKVRTKLKDLQALSTYE